jgi:flagella basal body P-ring formation protein FlgA
LRHAVAAAAPLLMTDVEMPRLLKRGQMATLQLHNRGLNVSSQVRILADASAGQQVEAVYPGTKKKLRVQAIDSHNVQLAF